MQKNFKVIISIIAHIYYYKMKIIIIKGKSRIYFIVVVLWRSKLRSFGWWRG